MKVGDIIVVRRGRGKRVSLGMVQAISSHFEPNSVGQVKRVFDSNLEVLLVGPNVEYELSIEDCQVLDVNETGDQFNEKICNRCHVLKPVGEFDYNQTQTKNRRIRRPSCRLCRMDIDRRYIPNRVKREAAKSKPPNGSVWRCPICEKQTIVGVTAKLVLDHDHRSGLTRGYICDSCNTGLGRFRNGKTYLQNAITWLEETKRHALVTWTDEEKKR